MNTTNTPLSFFEYLSVPLTKRTRLLLVVLTLPLLLSFWFPLWRISMDAPQYPKGLKLDIYSYTLDGGNEGRDLAEINLLNHYIGMQQIVEDELSDLDWIPFAFGVLVLLVLRAAALGSIRTLIDMAVITSYTLLFAFVRFIHMLYTFGHQLDPTAPVKVEPFTPVIVGSKKIANFTTHSYPQLGSILIGAFVLGLWVGTAWALYRGWKRAKEAKRAAIDVLARARGGAGDEAGPMVEPG